MQRSGGSRSVQEQRQYSPDAPKNRQPGRSPEVELLLLCARWPQRPQDCQLIQMLCDRPLDWRRFLLLVQHHRLTPLVSHNLLGCMAEAGAPERAVVFGELRGLAAANTRQALRCLGELRRILQEFQARNVRPLRVLKGLPLARAVFGDLSLRAAGDIDLLIDEASILEADRVLRALGYRGLFQLERLSRRRLAFYRAHWKDLAYRNPVMGFEVDLHWRGFRNSQMPGTALCATAAEDEVGFGEFRVATPPAMEGLLYLCVHGTLDGWLYLKSLADVGAQVRAMSEPQLDALAELAASYGVLPELSAALILVRRYLSLDHWSGRLLAESDATVGHILRYADQALVGSGFMGNRDDIPIAAMLAFEVGLRRNLSYRYELAVRVLFRARMWETMPLPDFLFGLYPVLSPVEWMVYRVRQWRAKPGGDASS